MSLVVLRVAWVALLTRVTVAFGTTAPEESCTTPCKLLVNCAQAGEASRTANASRQENLLRDMCTPEIFSMWIFM